MTRQPLPDAHGAWLTNRQIRAMVLIWNVIGFLSGLAVSSAIWWWATRHG